MNQYGPPHQSRASLVSFIAILLSSLFFAYKMIEPYLLTIIMGSILALLATPVFDRLTRKGLGRRKAAAVITLGAVSLVIVPLIVFATLAISPIYTTGGFP